MKTFILAVMLAAGCCSIARGQQLTLKVTNVSESKGHIRVAIFNSEADFLQKPVAAFAVEAVQGEVVIPCSGLPKGTYAITLFHDLNDNGYMDTGSMGIPTEDYGFSNNAKPVMGPPSYEKCCFTLDEELTMEIKLTR